MIGLALLRTTLCACIRSFWGGAENCSLTGLLIWPAHLFRHFLRRVAAAATSQAALAEVDPPPRQPPTPPRRPLCHLLSPPSTSGRRRVMSLGRAEMPTFSTLNLDGSSSPPPAPPPPSPPSPFICYDDCEDDEHCSDCGKCAVLCQEHYGCDCYGEEGLDITFHCAVCCCGRSLEGQYCKLKDFLSPESFHTASHPYL